MGAVQQFLHKLNNIFNMVTDWLLILIGAALVVKAIVAIDVPTARYVVMAAGIFLITLGFWSRYRRIQRYRQNEKKE